MNKDQVKGRMNEAKGKAKELAGKMTGKTSTEMKGKAEQVAGRTQSSYGDTKENLKKNPK
ncbi:CsbD family protein [Cupriavidus agavae]|uniref:CsbD-like protein n=1 Tax=Cupriavidus agavae TaxID=1001822 RepID=A0A4Q7S480_9BURK|nr:CsbD family protein [Cupriavidus agavae]RZT39602.1 CsbD-like protein [Cupriavidus agavae]